MLPDSEHQPYIEFEQQLQFLQTLVTRANPDAQEIQSRFLETQQWFQMQIAHTDADDSADAGKRAALHIEMHKQLRLLATDVMFLQAARQPVTRQQRQAQMRDRLTLLQRYCQAAIGETTSDRGGEDSQPMV